MQSVSVKHSTQLFVALHTGVEPEPLAEDCAQSALVTHPTQRPVLGMQTGARRLDGLHAPAGVVHEGKHTPLPSAVLQRWPVGH